MGIIELLLVGIGLSMDAFAVAVCKGLCMKSKSEQGGSLKKPAIFMGVNMKNIGLIALFFGGFQALMPLLGWILGKQFEKYIMSFDHWIAFALLVFIGGKMIADMRKDEENAGDCNENLKIKELFVLAIATSIDALAVGITFAFLKVNIWSAVGIIGVTTFFLSGAGVVIGNKFGTKYEKKAQLAGGIILILIGVKILLEHLGIISI